MAFAYLICDMKINIIPTTKFALLLTAVAAALLTFTPSARALTIGDAHELGFVNFGIPSGDADRTTYVNHLVGMALGTSDKADGQTYLRSNNTFSPLPTAVWASNGTSTTINLGSGLYTYLFAKYDGPNYGSEVWYVGDLSGNITIPATAGGYALSGWTLFGPGTPGVPTVENSNVARCGPQCAGIARRYMMS